MSNIKDPSETVQLSDVNQMKVLVCGGRDYNDFDKVCSTLDSIAGVTTIVSGGATGADAMSERWAEMRHVQIIRYPAQWKKFGRSAGPIRNQTMIDENLDIALLVAFPGGSGTRDMTCRAIAAKIPILTVEESKLLNKIPASSKQD